MNKRCLGCGIPLQNEDESLLGYTPDLKNTYCRRCFRLKNYGEKKLDESIKEETILSKVNQKKGISFFLLDFLNINAYTIKIFQKIKIPKVLVISKSDTLRPEMNPEKIKNWLKRVYQINESILFISSKPNFKSNNIFKVMDEENIKTAYIMGITNAGKSTFLNKLLKEAGIKKEILSSNKPNTTLDFIKMKIGDYTIYDTPGFSYPNDTLKIINTKIKPISYQIKPHTKLVINDTYEFFFPKENKVVFYGITPITRKYQPIKNSESSMLIPKNSDVVLPGIGFINIKDECNITSNKSTLEVRVDISEDFYE